MTIEKKIKKYFDDHYMFKSPYAEKAGITSSRFSRILNGKAKISAEEFYKLSRALGITMDDLWCYGDEDTKEV